MNFLYVYYKFNCDIKMSMGGLFEFGEDAGGPENYTSTDPVIYVVYEKKYIRVKTNGRVNQSGKQKRARPR